MAWRCLALTALLAAGCAGGGASGQPDAGGGGRVCTPGQPIDLNGRAGVLGTLNVHVNASGLVETDTTAELLLLLDVQQNGTAVGVSAKVCDLVIPEVPIAGQDQPIRFTLGEGLLDSVAQVDGTGTLDGTSSCAKFESAPITVVIGAHMDPPDQGMLPEADSTGAFVACAQQGTCAVAFSPSRCVCDQEGDSKPGATLLAMNVPAVSIKEVYVALRTTFSLSGQVFSSDEIEGEVTATLQQSILGCNKASGAACSSGEVGAVKNLNPDITQNADPSIFRAKRVADDADCAALLAMRDILFPR